MMSAMCITGRLAEVFCAPPFDSHQVIGLAGMLRDIMNAAVKPIVTCVDLRRVKVFPADVSDQLIAMMRSDNPRVERTGFVIEGSSLFGLQINRMVREANKPARRCFNSKEELIPWLSEVLTGPEHARLKQFLSGALEAQL